MRPKLARSLDDAGRRERECGHTTADSLSHASCSEMLSEMNEKLSEAARLYDRLLTSQISTSRYSAPQRTEAYLQHSASPLPYQPSVPPSHTNMIPQAYVSRPETQVHYEQVAHPQYAASMQQPEASQEVMTQAPAPPLTSQAYRQQHEVHSPGPSSLITPSNPVAIPPVQSSESQAVHQPLVPTSISPLNSHPDRSYAAVTQAAPTPLVSPPSQHYQSINSIPVFPSVPTAPLPNPTYRAPEPKEAMLISFD